ncbi:hypothetical protein SprV_0501748700 [Sparganum proliferum]
MDDQRMLLYALSELAFTNEAGASSGCSDNDLLLLRTRVERRRLLTKPSSAFRWRRRPPGYTPNRGAGGYRTIFSSGGEVRVTKATCDADGRKGHARRQQPGLVQRQQRSYQQPWPK